MYLKQKNRYHIIFLFQTQYCRIIYLILKMYNVHYILYTVHTIYMYIKLNKKEKLNDLYYLHFHFT